MHSKAKPPTLAERQRFAAIYETGCTPCWLRGIEFQPCTIQHVVEGRKRLGHSATYGACEWHHFGHPKGGLTAKQTEDMLGPSLALSKKKYVETFGSERELIELCNKMIEQYLQAWRGEYS